MWIESHLKGHIEWSKGLFGESRLWSEENSDLCFLSVLQGSLKLVFYPKICIIFLHSKISNCQETSIIIKLHGVSQKEREGVRPEADLKRVGMESKFEEQEVMSKKEKLASHLWQVRGEELLCAQCSWVCLSVWSERRLKSECSQRSRKS